ncbi:hypothetical protein BJX63DRAFT_438060 [Aspergillus granulosus]|uniref:Uncharacterized protein n=1 Tax=Aspergillus granulosus TaxID=176169 RepID=A0ABR4GUL0_9EURO
MPPPTLPPENHRERATAEEAVRWLLVLRLVNRTFNDLVIGHVLAALRAGKLERDFPLRRGPGRPSTIGFVRRLLRALVLRTAPTASDGATVSDGHTCSVVRTIVDGAALSADLLASSTGGDFELAETVTELRELYTEALISTLTHIIGPGLILQILQPGQEDEFDMFGPFNDGKQQWRIAASMAAAHLGRIADLKHL